MSLPPLLLSLLAGFLLSPYIETPHPWVVGLVSVVSLLLAIKLFQPWRQVSTCVAMFALALLLIGLDLRPPQDPDAVHRFAGPEKVAITGEVMAVGRSSSGRVYYDLGTERLVNHGIEVAAVGKIRLFLDSEEISFGTGDRISFHTRLRHPRNFNIPGEFDYVRYLAQRDIFALASIKDPVEIARLAKRRDLTFFERWRLRNAELIHAALPEKPRIAALLQALAQGERVDMTTDQREMLARSGISHLFAISGLHFGLVAAAFYLMVAAVWVRLPRLPELLPARQALPLLLVPLLYGYLSFTGGAVSSWRAFLMLFAGALVLARLRRVEPFRALCAVALVMLLIDPLLFYEASFQLSFSATLGIVLVSPKVFRALNHKPTWQSYPLMVIAVTGVAFFSTLPVVLFHFHQIAPAGLIVNAFAVPVVSLLILPLVILATCLGPVLPGFSKAVFYAGGVVLEYLLEFAVKVSGWFLLSPREWYMTTSEMVFVSCLVLALLFTTLRLWRPLVVTTVIALLTVLPWRGASNLAITALSVGQGESLLVTLPDDHQVLIDAGGFAGSDFDVGERLVVPALRAMGVEQLDAVVLTHEHPDHLLGIEAVLKKLPVKELWTAVEEWKLPEAVRKRLSEGAPRLRVPGPGWQLLQVGASKLQVYLPSVGKNANDRSLAVYVPGPAGGALMCADLEEEGVRSMLEQPLPGAVSLLKLPHHGSRHSSQQRLLETVGPQLGIVSAGLGNRYRLPHPQTVELYDEAHIPLWRTDLHGTIRTVSREGQWHVTRWKKERFR